MSEGNTVQISRMIDSVLEGKEAKDFEKTVLDPRGGVIELPIPLVNYRGRLQVGMRDGDSLFFDPEGAAEGLTNAQKADCIVQHVKVHPLPCFEKNGIKYLNRIQSAYNRLLAAIRNYKTGTHTSLSTARSFLQCAFSSAEDTIVKALGGKFGLIARHVMGTRLDFSMITPIQGTHTIDPQEVLVPPKYAEQIGLRDGDLVMVHREPLLWDHGIWFLTARVNDKEETPRIHWSVFPGMNADVDGDLMFMCNLSKQLSRLPMAERLDIEGEVYAAKQRDRGALSYDASLCLLDDSREPNLTNLEEDMAVRLDEDAGLSYGLEDVFGDDDFLGLIEGHLDFDPEKVRRVAAGFSEDEWTDEIQSTSEALAYTKRGLGPVGAMGNYCLILARKYPDALRGALHIKQGLSQVVLDAKHGEDLDGINSVLGALNKAGPFESATVQERIDGVVAGGFPEGHIRPLIEAIGNEGLVSKVFKEFPAFLLGCSDSNTLGLLERFMLGEPDAAGPGQDAGAWYDHFIRR